MFQPLIFRGLHVVNTRQMMSQHSVNFTKGRVLNLDGVCHAQNCPGPYSWMACNAFLWLVVLPLNAHGRIFQHWKHLNFQVKQNHCNMPFRFNQTYLPTCQKAKRFQYPCRLGGWWTWLHFRNTYFTSDIKVFCSNIQFTSTLLALHNAKRF